MSETEKVANQEHQRRLRNWISKVELRISELLDYDIAELTGAEREVAASRLLVTMGRMIELEQQLSQANVIPAADETLMIEAIIYGSNHQK